MSDFKSSDRIRRAKHERNYTVILNSTIQDSRLSWKARGLHHYILSLPDDWHICVAHLAEQSEPDGEAIIKSALKELESNGYISKTRLKDERGRFLKCVWDIYESPQVDFQPVAKVNKRKASKQSPQVDFPQVDKPQVDKPQVDKPQVENRALISNDQPSTDLTSTDQQKKESDFFENLPIEEKKENLGYGDNPKNTKTPPVVPPVDAMRNYSQEMSDRFNSREPSRKKQTEPLTKDDDFLKYLFIELRKTKAYFRDIQDKDDLTPVRGFIRKCWIIGSEGDVRFAEIQDYLASYEKYKESQTHRSQQQPTPQLAPPKDNAVYTVPSFVKDFAKSRKAP